MSEARTRPGSIIALLGPNGSGKTTVAKLMIEQLAPRFEKTRYLHSRTLGVLPKLGSLRRDTKPRPRAHIARGTPGFGMIEPAPVWRAIIYPIYYAFDMLLARPAFRRIRRSGELLIFDRYYYDYYYDRSSRLVPRWLLDMMRLLVPEPDLILFPERSAAEINEGKPELDIEEIEVQQQRIRDFLGNRRIARVIDASHGAEETARLACEEIEASRSVVR